MSDTSAKLADLRASIDNIDAASFTCWPNASAAPRKSVS